MLTTQLLTALRDERIDFGEFIRETQGDFLAMATKIARDWGTLPPAIEVQDLQQDMLLAVHTGLRDFETDRAYDLRAFIVWRVCSVARKELQRQAKLKNCDNRCTQLDVQQPVQEAMHLAHQRVAMLPIGDRQAAIINSLVRTGSVDRTANDLLIDFDTQRLFMPRIRRRVKQVSQHGRQQARYAVLRTARKLAHRAQTTA